MENQGRENNNSMKFENRNSNEFRNDQKNLNSKDSEQQREAKIERLFKSLSKKQDSKVKNVSVRASESDYVMIRAKAKLLGVSMSEFLLDCASSKKVAGYDEIKEKIEEIFK